MILFFDTYALVEITKGSKNYEKYKEYTIITTLLNLMELHYALLKDLGEQRAQAVFDELIEFTIEFDEQDVINANIFRYNQNKKGKKLSYIDSVGYILSVKNNIKFLTGDNEFKEIENVEFVKAD